MVNQNKRQKQLRLNRYELVSALLSEDKEIKGLTESQVAEQILMDYYMPNFCFQVVVDLYEERISFNTALQEVLTALLSQKSFIREKMKPLIVLIWKVMIFSNPNICVGTEEYSIFQMYMSSLIDTLEMRLLFNYNDEQVKIALANIKSLYKSLELEKENFNISNIIPFFITNWNLICDNDNTIHILNKVIGVFPDFIITNCFRHDFREILKGIELQEEDDEDDY